MLGVRFLASPIWPDQKGSARTMDRPCALVPQTTVRRIQDMIRSGALKPGAPLPPQRELAERLEVSRASLREALSALGTLGLLRTEARRGTYVAERGETDGQSNQPRHQEKARLPSISDHQIDLRCDLIWKR